MDLIFFWIDFCAPKQEFAEGTFGTKRRFTPFHQLISMDRTSDIMLMGISETSLFNAHFQRFIMTLCVALVMKNNSAIHVGCHRLLSVDRLRDFEQVYVLLVPSGLGIPPNLLFVLFYTLAIQTAL